MHKLFNVMAATVDKVAIVAAFQFSLCLRTTKVTSSLDSGDGDCSIGMLETPDGLQSNLESHLKSETGRW